jgi:hypothetical protein
VGEEIVPKQANTDRAKAVRNILPALRDLFQVEDLRWADVEKDLRLLVINHVIRRQLEALEASLNLASADLGHLSVSFIRPALEEMIWVKYLSSLPLATSQRLLLALANYDSLRSLNAQRAYVGDEAMHDLWYTPGFLKAVEKKLPTVEGELVRLRKELKWSGGRIPSTDWIAEAVSEQRIYKYLHAATSRSLHFSAGEILRRGWGHPRGIVTTDKPEFRIHLSEFALDKLWRLFFETAENAMPLISDSGITSEDSLTGEHLLPLVQSLLDLGMVPLVHAHEWNLTPEGPLDLS